MNTIGRKKLLFPYQVRFVQGCRCFTLFNCVTVENWSLSPLRGDAGAAKKRAKKFLGCVECDRGHVERAL